MSKDIKPEVYTISAFLLGYLLIDTLSSTEQSQLGNWFMLVGQTLCTNGSYNFNNDWNGHLGEGHKDIRDMLSTVKDSIDRVNNIMK